MPTVICVQYRDGIEDEEPIVIPPLENETVYQTLERKMKGADLHDWNVEKISETEFRAWKEYADGNGTPDRPNKKDRYFRIVD